MARLTLLIGPAGSGKTHRVLTEAARAALEGPLPGEAAPPLLVIVPEQQAAGTERALLEHIAAISGSIEPASTRLRVMSLTRLARVLGDKAGTVLPPLGDLGRRLLIWRLVEEGSEPARRARAVALADAVAELALYEVTPEQLEERSAALAAAGTDTARTAALRAKLNEAARVLRELTAQCRARGLDMTPAPARVPELLTADNWPGLNLTRVWVDGFAGFTPAEETALTALLKRCAAVTATVLLDPARLDGPLPADTTDWFAPTRRTLGRWRELARQTGAPVQAIELRDTPRWPAGSPLARLAMPGAATTTTTPDENCGGATVLANERGEVDHCARTILDLVNNRGLRFGEVSVTTRTLEPYADLVATRFAEHGIPCYLDRREPAAAHPLVEQLRCGVRLALGQAAEEDVFTLVKTGLLPAQHADGTPWTAPELRDRADRLENYARAHGLRPGHWLQAEPWHWEERIARRSDDDDDYGESPAARLTAELDGWRRELLAPVAALVRAVHGAPEPAVDLVLANAWEHLAGAAVQRRLEDWAAAAETAEPPRPAEANLHRRIAGLLAALCDELHNLAGDLALGAGGISRGEFCTWLEYGLGSLSLGQPPLRLDSVLITEIERGRHHPVRATLLLGMAEDAWPPPAQETALFSDAEREMINSGLPGERGLLAAGAVERAEREPYLALVALTRAAEYLGLSRPGADDKGAARPPSPYNTYAVQALGLTEEQPEDRTPAAVGTPLDLACWAGVNGAVPAARELLDRSGVEAAAARCALDWGTGYEGSHTGLEPLAAGQLAGLTGSPAPDRLILRGSTSRLEAFAACPFKHFARYFLGLRERPEGIFDQRTLGSFYHEVLQRTVDSLNREGYPWPGDPREVYDRALAVLADAVADLAAETGRERSAHIAERARIVLWHQAHTLCDQLAGSGRRPRATELRIGGRGEHSLPPLVVEGDGLRLELHGFIDRLDTGPGGLTVVDYKFRGGEVRWDRFLAGAQIQLFAYLLAARETPYDTDGGHDLDAVEYQPIELSWKDGLARFEAKSEPPLREREKYEGLLENTLSEVRRVMLELSGRLLGGEIAPLPLSWQNGKTTACMYCDFRGLCRFDPQVGDSYREVIAERNNILRKQVLDGEDFTGSALAAPAGEVRDG